MVSGERVCFYLEPLSGGTVSCGIAKLHKLRSFILLLACLANAGCGVLKKREPSPTEQVTQQRQLSQEEAKEVLGEVGENWLYGPGLGKAVVNVAGVVVFPPYVVYLLGNGLVSAFGYEPVYITDALPDEEREQYNEVYDSVTSVPGRFSATVAEEEYRSEEVVKERMARFKTPKEVRDDGVRAQSKAERASNGQVIASQYSLEAPRSKKQPDGRRNDGVTSEEF